MTETETKTETGTGGSAGAPCSATLGDVEYFRGEAMRLREMWGNKDFWRDTERAGRAISALTFVWANTDAVTESDKLIMHAMIREYDTRLRFALSFALTAPNDSAQAPDGPKTTL
jgi:hypothetical protein